jgi:hypothetical protein
VIVYNTPLSLTKVINFFSNQPPLKRGIKFQTMIKNAILVSLVSLILSINCIAQQHKPLSVEFISGYNNTTISKGMKGFYIQTGALKEGFSFLNYRVSLGIAKSSSFPIGFDNDSAPYDAKDSLRTINSKNGGLVKLVKSLSAERIGTFELVEATNIYLGFNADLKLLKLKKNISVWGTLGTNFQNTFGTTLYIKESFFVNGKLYEFTPATTFNAENVISFNVGCRIKYDLNNSTSILLNCEKFFGDNGNGNFSKAEFINLGVGISKQLNFK